MPTKKVYIKDNSSFAKFNKTTNKAFLARGLVPQFLMFAGVLVLVTQVVIPLTFFESIDDTALGYFSGFKKFEFKELQKSTDLSYSNLTGDTKPEVAGSADIQDANIPEKFFLSIPKLGIEEALVETNSTDLSPDDRLGHYMGSSLPGEPGNAFIYGHSVIPIFYNPNNYKTIFSTLGSLSVGDKFFIRYNNKVYTYKVENLVKESPDKVDPLATWKPEYLNQDTVTLMTCWPPGTKINRLLVNATRVN